MDSDTDGFTGSSDANMISCKKLSRYEYTPLHLPHFIRLLNLLPAAEPSSGIICEIFESWVGEVDGLYDSVNLKYEALSWVWGSGHWEECIRVRTPEEDFQLMVPTNLVVALRALRYSSNTRRLWVDAICINQNDTEEKNVEVALMDEIYSGAHSVCVWLGPSDEDSEQAMRFIQHELGAVQEFDTIFVNENAIPKWRSLMKLIKRTWFTRRWVVQEIVLARKATLYCGSDSVSWQDFSETIQLFLDNEAVTYRFTELLQGDTDSDYSFHREYLSSLGASLLVNATSGTLFRTSNYCAKEPRCSLEYLVCISYLFEVSNPRDSVYSLLGISKNTQRVDYNGPLRPIHMSSSGLRVSPNRQLVPNRLAYKVDYRLPIEVVFKQFIWFAIQQSDPLRALDIICRPWAPLPTEAKDYSSPKRPSWISTLDRATYRFYEVVQNGDTKLGRANADPLVGLPEPDLSLYGATGGRGVNLSKLWFHKGDAFYSMYVEGFILDIVAKTSSLSNSGVILGDWLIRLGGWKNLNNNPPEDLWRTLVGDRGMSGRNAPTYFARALKEAVAHSFFDKSLHTTRLINLRISSATSELFRRMQAVTWNRRLIRTESGDLGIVPSETRSRDLVCILYGCSVPVILRRKKRHHSQSEELLYNQQVESAAMSIQRLWREKKHASKDGIVGKDSTSASINDMKRAKASSLAALAATTASRISSEPILKNSNSLKSIDTTLSDATDSSASISKRHRKHSTWQRPTGHGPETVPEPKFYYELIGECYVHGMMDGDAIWRQYAKQIASEVFELR